MNIHRVVAVTAAVGALSLGGAGVAVAASGSGSTPTPSTAAPASPTGPAKCTNVAAKLKIANSLDQAAGQRLALLQQALTNATAKGKQTRVTRLTDRINKLTTRKQKLEARMQKCEQRCGSPAPAAT
jgi:hypothetical protein